MRKLDVPVHQITLAVGRCILELTAPHSIMQVAARCVSGIRGREYSEKTVGPSLWRSSLYSSNVKISCSQIKTHAH